MDGKRLAGEAPVSLRRRSFFIDPSFNPASAGTVSPDVPLSVETRDRLALVTHHRGDHFDAGALRSVLGDSGILVVPESVAQ